MLSHALTDSSALRGGTVCCPMKQRVLRSINCRVESVVETWLGIDVHISIAATVQEILGERDIETRHHEMHVVDVGRMRLGGRCFPAEWRQDQGTEGGLSSLVVVPAEERRARQSAARR